jgi:hypothetical protein
MNKKLWWYQDAARCVCVCGNYEIIVLKVHIDWGICICSVHYWYWPQLTVSVGLAASCDSSLHVGEPPKYVLFYCYRPSNLPCGHFLMFIFRGARIVSGLQSGRSGVWIPAWAKDSCLFQNLHTGSGAHPAPCAKGTGVLSRSESVGAWGWPFTSI